MNPLLDHITPSLIRAVHHRKKPGDVDLGLGEPVLPIDMAPLESAMRWMAAHGCPYTENPGFPELRAAIAAYFAYPHLPSADNVCVTVGSAEAIYLALKAIANPATDEALIPTPTYPVYDKICLLEHLRYRTVEFPADTDFAPSADTVLAALRDDTRIIVLCTPSNPTGRIWPREELQKLANGLLARKGAPIQVISDEVYRALYYADDAPASIADFYPHSWITGSLSKSHAYTGLRLGYLLGPADGIATLIKLHHLMVTAASTFSQRVALDVFAHPASFAAHRAIYQTYRPQLLATLDAAGLRYVAPDGAFYCMIQLPEPHRADSVTVAFALVDDAHVVAVPGTAFGNVCEGWLRVSWAAAPDTVREGITRIQAWLASTA